jgi:hypothetical protein
LKAASPPSVFCDAFVPESEGIGFEFGWDFQLPSKEKDWFDWF